MNLEEIKEDRKHCYAGVEYELEDCIDWLIAEVERLKNSKHMGVNALITTKIETATRCAEIADEYFKNCSAIDSYSEGWRDCADAIEATIQKEYGIEKQ